MRIVVDIEGKASEVAVAVPERAHFQGDLLFGFIDVCQNTTRTMGSIPFEFRHSEQEGFDCYGGRRRRQVDRVRSVQIKIQAASGRYPGGDPDNVGCRQPQTYVELTDGIAILINDVGDLRITLVVLNDDFCIGVVER